MIRDCKGMNVRVNCDILGVKGRKLNKRRKRKAKVNQW